MPTRVCPNSCSLHATATCFVPSKTWINQSSFPVCTAPLFCSSPLKKHVYQYDANTKPVANSKRWARSSSWQNYARWPCDSAKRLFVSLSTCTQEVLAHMPASVLRAWSQGSGPCQADWEESVHKVCKCECVNVCLHLLQLRGIVWHVTPDPAPLGENIAHVRAAQVSRCRCGRVRRTYAHWCVYVGTCIHLSLSAFVRPGPAPVTIPSKHKRKNSVAPTPPPPTSRKLSLCVLEQMGCQGHLWPPAAQWLMGRPSPVTPPPPLFVQWRASDTSRTHLLGPPPPSTWAF